MLNFCCCCIGYLEKNVHSDNAETTCADLNAHNILIAHCLICPFILEFKIVSRQPVPSI